MRFGAMRVGWSVDEASTPDAQAFGADRASLFERLLAEGARVLTTDDGRGFTLARRGSTATYLGPLVPVNAAVAKELLNQALHYHAGTDVCLDVHLDGMIDFEQLVSRNLSRRLGLTRIRHGAVHSPASPSILCASTGPEFG